MRPDDGKELRIEPATIEQIPRLAELLGLLFAQEADFAPDADRQCRALRMILAEPDRGFVLTATQSNRITGMVSVLILTSTAEGGPVGMLEDLIVDPVYRSQGVGSRLIETAIAEAAARGLTRLTLLTDANNEGAQRLYARHGFGSSGMRAMRRKIDD